MGSAMYRIVFIFAEIILHIFNLCLPIILSSCVCVECWSFSPAFLGIGFNSISFIRCHFRKTVYFCKTFCILLHSPWSIGRICATFWMQKANDLSGCWFLKLIWDYCLATNIFSLITCEVLPLVFRLWI